MPTFKYSAIGQDGRTVRGSLGAGTQAELVEELRKRNLMPLKIESRAGGDAGPTHVPAAPAPAAVSSTGVKAFPKKGWSLGKTRPGVRRKEETVLFTRQLATMIGAGIPMLESLEILREQAESKQFAMLLDCVINDVRSGQDLSMSFSKHPKVFSDVYVSMIKAGEASGQIDDILERLADYMEATQRLKRDIKSAMTYPVVSLVMIMGITTFLMMGIVPKFKEVFSSLDVQLPGLTRGVL